MSSTGASYGDTQGLHRRQFTPEQVERQLDDITEQTKALLIKPEPKWHQIMVEYVNPIIVLVISAVVRLHGIDLAKSVMWDEAHFGKFGSYYLKREVYFDVHPPLGKLLVGLSGWLAGYDGQFEFNLGKQYDSSVNYLPMRVFNAMFGIMCAPVAYKTAVAMGYNQWTVWFISLLVCLEFQLLCLSKFILLDSFLLFFTVLTFYCLVKIHNCRVNHQLLKRKGLTWLVALGFNVGCVCLVKWVGLFVTVLVGLYTIYDLVIRTYEVLTAESDAFKVKEKETDNTIEYNRIGTVVTSSGTKAVNEDKHSHQKITWKNYFCHWIVRIVTLIIIPFIIYLICFKVHFTVLNRLGSGDGLTLTLFQLNLEGNQVVVGPRDVAYGSMVTIRSQGLLPNLLHSHGSQYPEGTTQQQVTTYGFRDGNNDFFFEFGNEQKNDGILATMEGLDPQLYKQQVAHGDVVRLVHKETNRVLRANDVKAPVLKQHMEVSCHYQAETVLPDGNDFSNDEWEVEVMEQLHAHEKSDVLHPILTNFRLKNRQLGCYLSTTGLSYPSWGFGQGEVACLYLLFSRDKSTWWNIEDHTNDQMPPAVDYVPPKPRFWKEFVLLNYGMMALNNALIPDPDKYDRLASLWWQWPTVNVGLRMGSWGSNSVRYFLVGHPFTTLFSTFSIGVFISYLAVLLFRWRRQAVSGLGPYDKYWNELVIRGIAPFLGWFLNYYPFIIMGRVTYVHHYVPAQYFAIFISAFILDQSAHMFGRTRPLVYAVAYAGVVGGFWYYGPLVLGMTGSLLDYQKLRLFDSWMI